MDPRPVYREEHTQIRSENGRERPRLHPYLTPRHTQIPVHTSPRHSLSLQLLNADMLPVVSSMASGGWGGAV